jgi:hypothetical protein
LDRYAVNWLTRWVGGWGLTYSGRIVAPVHTGRSGTGPWDRTDRLLRGHSRRTSSYSCWLLLWLLATACGDPGWNRRTRCSSWSTCPLHLFIDRWAIFKIKMTNQQSTKSEFNQQR